LSVMAGLSFYGVLESSKTVIPNLG
jgi:hypothetical protein